MFPNRFFNYITDYLNRRNVAITISARTFYIINDATLFLQILLLYN